MDSTLAQLIAHITSQDVEIGRLRAELEQLRSAVSARLRAEQEQIQRAPLEWNQERSE